MTSTDRLATLLQAVFRAHPWHGIATSSADTGMVNAFIEIVPTDTVKYEMDKQTGRLRLDRPHRFSSFCPTLYGFVPQTYCAEAIGARCAERTGAASAIIGDGDPLDICVLTEKNVAHGDFLCRARPIGGLRLLDGNEADDKIVAVLEDDIAFGALSDLHDVPAGFLDRLEHYFLSYKQRPDEPARRIHIAERFDRAEALRVIELSQVDYRAHFGDPGARLDELRKLLRE